MAWELDDDDRDEIAETFASFGGALCSWMGVIEDERGQHGERTAYMREVRRMRLPEAQRARARENKRRRNAFLAKKARDAALKRVERNPALVQPVDDKRGQRAWGFASAVRKRRRCA